MRHQGGLIGRDDGRSARWTLGAVAQHVVGEDQRHHRFDDGHGPWSDAGIVAATGVEDRFLPLAVDSLLLPHDGRCGFEGDPSDYRLAVGYPARRQYRL